MYFLGEIRHVSREHLDHSAHRSGLSGPDPPALGSGTAAPAAPPHRAPSLALRVTGQSRAQERATRTSAAPCFTLVSHFVRPVAGRSDLNPHADPRRSAPPVTFVSSLCGSINKPCGAPPHRSVPGCRPSSRDPFVPRPLEGHREITPILSWGRFSK